MTNSCLAQRGCQAGKNLKTKVLLMGDGEEEGKKVGKLVEKKVEKKVEKRKKPGRLSCQASS